MSMTYTFAQQITTAGVTGPTFNALHNPATSGYATVVVTPARNQDNDAVTISIPAGHTIPLKVRQAKPSANIIGLL
jgi:hypothetical protein